MAKKKRGSRRDSRRRLIAVKRGFLDPRPRRGRDRDHDQQRGQQPQEDY